MGWAATARPLTASEFRPNPRL